jgi:hypothetical protein
MPLFVTDTDVLDQIASDDAQAASVAAQMASMGATVPAATMTAWTSDLASYRAWAGAAKTRLSGGFLSGEWFGVPADGDAAIAWSEQFAAYQAILTAIQKGATPAALVPTMPNIAQVEDANSAAIVQGATGAVGSVAGSLEGPVKWLAIGATALAVGYVVLSRRR